jgi:hypothetical protein
VLRRCPTILAAPGLALTLAAALTFVVLPTPASAENLPPSYTLTVDKSIPQIGTATTLEQSIADAQAYQKAIADTPSNSTPTVSTPQIIARIEPPGSLQNPASGSGSGSSSSSGSNPLSFAQTAPTYGQIGMVDNLLGPIQSGNTQYMAFALFGEPLQPGEKIVFSLTDPNLIANPPQFIPVDANGNTDPGIHITLNPRTDGGPSTTDGSGEVKPTVDTSGNTQSQVPEPLSLVVWSTLAGLGLWRARRLRSCN